MVVFYQFLWLYDAHGQNLGGWEVERYLFYPPKHIKSSAGSDTAVLMSTKRYNTIPWGAGAYYHTRL